MSEATSPASAAPRLNKSVPYVWVQDLEDGKRYFTEKLGFDEHYCVKWQKYGRTFGIVGMCRGEIEVQLSICSCDDHRHDGRAYFVVYVEGVDALHAELAERGANIWCPLKQEDWGGWSFSVEDPWGNRICFVQLPG